MPTPEQIEAVARAISGSNNSEARVVAKSAIADYEATRPAVTDDQLRHLFHNTFAKENNYREGESSTDRWIRAQNAGIRAVRERLAGVAVPDLPEWVNSVYIQLIGDRWQDNEGGMWWERIAHGDGPTIEAALSAALAESGKEGR